MTKIDIYNRLRVHAAWANRDCRLGDQEAFDLAADKIDSLRSALRHAVSALEMVTDQNAIKSSTVANAFTSCVEAAAIGRNVLADQNPIKTIEAQGEGRA